ncbi:iron ABC transporter [Methanocella sp. CWC-04]|uniref:Iron ABC transporter n=1 Tax=Methanooceanicella nereidis TaxID=2052831 RepID=A0AAP2REZ0_9EURY|nr:iron chelate uptake ABC transporter family permease subunit [Methanocella sp. CWC-04]MCD1294977.1 iron ABC transporter [Methanocella sp. CWC-04]
MEKTSYKWTIIIVVLIIALISVVVISTAIGPVQISPDNVLLIILSNVPLLCKDLTFTLGIGDLSFHVQLPHIINIAKTWTTSQENIIMAVRLPRVLLGILVGASLAVAGVTAQAIFRNPMADPYILGISSGAAFGASIVIVMGISAQFLTVGVPLGSFIGAMICSFLVFGIAKKGNKVPVETLLLSGIAVSAFFSAMTSFMMYVGGNSLHQIVYWIMGALWSGGWDDVMVLGPVAIISILIITFFSRDLNVLLLGDETASHLGTDVSIIKIFMIGLTSLVAAVAVSVSGIIGFVGLVIPHIMRLIVGPDHRILIPSSVLMGAIFLTVADTFSRVIIQPTELPVGIITALIGAPFFIYLLRKKKKSPL